MPGAGGTGWGDIGGPGKNPGGRGGCTEGGQTHRKRLLWQMLKEERDFVRQIRAFQTEGKAVKPRVMEQHGVCREAAIPWKAGFVLARMLNWDFEHDLGDAGKSLIKGRQHSDVVTFVQLEACLKV